MSQPTEGQSPPRDQSPWTRPRFIASAAVVVVLAALGIVYLALPSPSGGQAPAPAPSAMATATATAQTGQSVCGLPAGDQRYPSVGLPTKWELLGRIAVPTDPKGIGPGKTDGNVRTCYQHSPTGALYAAANIAAAAFLPDGESIGVKDLSAPGPRRDQFLASPHPSAASPDQSQGAQIGGFQIQSYADQAASVVIGLKNSQGGHGSLTLPLKWVNGDWKLDYDSSGSITTVNDLSTFVPWSGA
ncbi:hypothetical protein J2W21_003577 [Sinomonas atrocyanea]|uniref:hypothetical protein n=1 Tax=Sinomonas atrocyanea TaxID=37927 RepID=UPI002785003E|nr:hypothetical protein [Sinomonas atrocyanea]MDP9886052.1 hypothetical protein [Sinomonas atrocyanea]